MKRRQFIAGLGSAAVVARAQQPDRMRRLVAYAVGRADPGSPRR